jgi:hypothetical protein
MPTFDTPLPITAHIEVPVGDIHLRASDRPDTTVSVRPTNPGSKTDVQAAEQTTVALSGGHLVVRAPKTWRRYSPFGPGPSVDVVVELPSGSHVEVEGAWVSVRSDGRLGNCRCDTANSVRLGEVADLSVSSPVGDVTATAAERVTVTAKAGGVRIRAANGPVDIKNSHGAVWLGTTHGPVRASTSSGDIDIEHAGEAVTARTAYGSIRVNALTRGASLLQTSYGGIEVGIPEGIAVWLDVSAKNGRVHNYLSATDAPTATDRAIEVRAHTGYGDIIIRRTQ